MRKKTHERLLQEERDKYENTNIIVYAPTGEAVFESTVRAAHETVGPPGNGRTVGTFGNIHTMSGESFRMFVARPLDDATRRAQAKAVHPTGKKRG